MRLSDFAMVLMTCNNDTIIGMIKINYYYFYLDYVTNVLRYNRVPESITLIYFIATFVFFITQYEIKKNYYCRD